MTPVAGLSRRAVLIAVVALLAVGGITAGALAASGAFDPGAQRQAFLDDAAGRLGVSSQKLEDALKQAAIDRVDAALAAGTITQAQADRLKAVIESGKLPLPRPGFGARFHFGRGLGAKVLGLSAAATYLGLTQDELSSRLRAGQSLADIAKAQGKSVDGLEQALLATARSKLDQAVAAGKLTPAQRDSIVTRLQAGIARLVERSFRPMPSPA